MSLSNRRVQDMPTLDKPSLGLEPVARMQELLHAEDMVVADGNHGVQLPGGIVIHLSQLLDRLSEIQLKLPLQV